MCLTSAGWFLFMYLATGVSAELSKTLYIFLLLNNHVLDFYSCFWDCFLKFIFVVSHIHPCFGSTMC